MTLSYLEQRAGRLTASSVAAVVGVDPYRNSHDVALEIMGKVPGFTGNAATEAGSALEPSILAWGAKELGRTISASNQWRVGEMWNGTVAEKRVGATIDAILAPDALGHSAILEAKTAGIVNPFFDGEEWGESLTDEVPAKYIVQVTMQMLCSDIRNAYLAALLGNGMGFRLYHIPFDLKIAEMLEDGIHKFWAAVSKGEMPPLASRASDDSIKKMIRRSGAGILIEQEEDMHKISRWQELREQRLEIEKAEEAAKYDALALLGDAERALLPDGRVLDYPRRSRSGIDSTKLKQEYPEIAAACTTSSEYRQASLRKAKKGEAQEINLSATAPDREQPVSEEVVN